MVHQHEIECYARHGAWQRIAAAYIDGSNTYHAILTQGAPDEGPFNWEAARQFTRDNVSDLSRQLAIFKALDVLETIDLGETA